MSKTSFFSEGNNNNIDEQDFKGLVETLNNELAQAQESNNTATARAQEAITLVNDATTVAQVNKVAVETAAANAAASELSAAASKGAAKASQDAAAASKGDAMAYRDDSAAYASTASQGAATATAKAQVATDASTAATASQGAALAAKVAAEAARDITTAARDVTTAARDVTTAARDTAVSKANALAAQLASFNEIYIGKFAVAPTLDGNGNPLKVGAIYENTTQGKIYQWESDLTWHPYDEEAQTALNNAVLSANNAAASAGTASTQASNAATSAANALTSEQHAKTSETNAKTSETNTANMLATKADLAGANFTGPVTASKFLTASAEAFRLNNNNGYLAFYNTANTNRSGFIQFNAALPSVISVDIAQPLAFQVNGAERMRVDEVGNVLVNKTGLQYPLDGNRRNFEINGATSVMIAGTIANAPAGYLYSDLNGTELYGDKRLDLSVNGAARVRIDNAGGLTVLSNTGSFSFAGGGALAQVNNYRTGDLELVNRVAGNGINFYVGNGTFAAKFDSSGRMGLGVTAPRAKLDIDSGANGGVLLDHFYSYGATNWALKLDGQDNTSGGYLSQYVVNGGFHLAQGGWYYGGGPWITDAKSTSFSSVSGYNGTLIFHTNSGIGVNTQFTPTERMRIDDSGRVAIGTVPVAYKLHVDGGSGIAISGGGNTSQAGGSLYLNAVSSTTSPMVGIKGVLDWAGGNEEQGSMAFLTRNTTGAVGAVMAERMRITAAGTVGIGTNNPASLLHVNGRLTAGTLGANGQYAVTLNPDTAGYSVYHFRTGVAGKDAFTIVSGSDPYTGTERFRIEGAGNVGIGGPAKTKLYIYDGDIVTESTASVVGGKIGAVGFRPYVGYAQPSQAGMESWVPAGSAGVDFADLRFNTCYGNPGNGAANGVQERMRITADGNVLIGTTTGNGAHAIRKTGATPGNLVLGVGPGGGDSHRFYVADTGGANAAACAYSVDKMNSTGRSINTAGFVSTSGNDYAEYMTKADNCGIIDKGDIAGVDANGFITDQWGQSVSFLIKTTNPSFVGGDTWGVGIKDPDQLEAERRRVDRMAYAGQVPVNVLGAKPGDYIVPAQDGKGIKGVVIAKDDLTMQQYFNAVGIVQNILPDGRANVRVKVA